MAENRCWSCRFTCQSKQDLQSHLHETTNFKEIKLPWDDDKYLKPFMEEDNLLFSFEDDDEGEDDCVTSFDKEKCLKDFGHFEDIRIDDDNNIMKFGSDRCIVPENGKEISSTSNGLLNVASSSQKVIVNGQGLSDAGASEKNPRDTDFLVSHLNFAAKDIKRVNENYFGSYSSFGIHREMISDKVNDEFLTFWFTIRLLRVLFLLLEGLFGKYAICL